MKPELCPRFEACSAAVCPLDGFTLGVHRPKEKTCFYLRAASKGKTDLIPAFIQQAVLSGYEDVIYSIQGNEKRFHYLRKQLEQSSKSRVREFKIQ
jgi:hypothetical protein